jgi:hypothetical protein
MRRILPSSCSRDALIQGTFRLLKRNFFAPHIIVIYTKSHLNNPHIFIHLYLIFLFCIPKV